MPDAATRVRGPATPGPAASVLPQAWKVIRTRDAEAIPAGMHAVNVVGFSLRLAYGSLLRQWPLIITKGVCLMKLLPRHQKEKVAEVPDPAAGWRSSDGRSAWGAQG